MLLFAARSCRALKPVNGVLTMRLSKTVAADRKKSYTVHLSSGISTNSVAELADVIGSRRSLLVTTPTVARLYASNIVEKLLKVGSDAGMLVIRCSEELKSLSEVEKLCQKCFSADLDRTSVLIGCGGGVCTDLVTMAASLTRRGLSYIRIPSTLIGQIDAGIGIKGAVNLPGKKSAIGCFYAPEHVFLEPAFLRTLPKSLIADGLAEAVKLAVVLAPDLFNLLERYASDLLERPSTLDIDIITRIVWRATEDLLDELETNIYEEKSYCRLLDFGHSFSPLIESESQFRITHGKAVSLDIALSTALACEMGLISAGDRERILTLLLRSSLPIFSQFLTLESCQESLAAMEEHRGGRLNLVLPTGVGSAMFVAEMCDVDIRALQRALDFLDWQAQSSSIATYPTTVPVLRPSLSEHNVLAQPPLRATAT